VQQVIAQKHKHDDDLVQQVLELAEQLAALKGDILPLLGLIRLWVRDQMIEAGQAGDSMIKGCEARLNALDQAQRQLARNCNRTLVCEVLLFNLQSPEPRVFL
jgi:DNA polymerase-3 subunit delta'